MEPLFIRTNSRTKAVQILLNEQIRYVLIDSVTSEIVDNAKGFGYKSKRKAHMGYQYKCRYLEQKEEQNILYWLESHPDLWMYSFSSTKALHQYLIHQGIADVPCSTKKLFKILKKVNRS